MAAQLLQAAGTMGSDAADRDSQLDADLGVRHRRILDERCDQLPGVRGQLRKRLAQSRGTLGSEQFRIHRPCHRVDYPCVVLPVVRSVLLLCRTQDPATFPAGSGGEPAGKCGWLAYGREVTNELEPDVLPDIVSIHLAQPVSAAYRPDQRGIPLEEFVPRVLVAVPGACYQCGDR